MDLGGLFPAGRRQAHNEGTPVIRAGLAREQSAGVQPVQHAGQRRTFVGECAMQVRYGRTIKFVKVTQDVGFRLREIGRMPLDVEPNPMGGAVNAEDKFETHQVKDTPTPLTIDSTFSYITIMNYSAGVLMGCLACAAFAQTREHREAGFTLRLPAPPSVVFPLFGPVRESEWAPHWNPTILFPPDGSQRAGAVFTTRQHDHDVVWVLTTYDEAALRISYVIVRPGRSAGQLDIALKAIGEKETKATLTHRLTSLSEEGDGYVKDFVAQFPMEREHWQHAINGRLHELMKR